MGVSFLRFAGPRCKGDKEVVLAAVRSNWRAFRYAEVADGAIVRALHRRRGGRPLPLGRLEDLPPPYGAQLRRWAAERAPRPPRDAMEAHAMFVSSYPGKAEPSEQEVARFLDGEVLDAAFPDLGWLLREEMLEDAEDAAPHERRGVHARQ